MAPWSKPLHLASVAACALAIGMPVAGDAQTAGVATGAVRIVTTVTAGPNVASGSQVSVSASLSNYDTTFGNSSSVYTGTTASGGSITSTTTIPYRFSIAGSGETITVGASLSASYASGSSSTYFSKQIPIPANGTTTTVAFSGSL